MKIESIERRLLMSHIRHHRHAPLWLEMWHIFALTATGVGVLLLLLTLAAVAMYG